MPWCQFLQWSRHCGVLCGLVNDLPSMGCTPAHKINQQNRRGACWEEVQRIKQSWGLEGLEYMKLSKIK